MSNVVIRARDLRKVYRLYSKPSYRFRDMFGLLGEKAGAYTEHAALDGINLEISRGEKIAIIGRNGAGKSTFLKLVTKVIQPTSGTLQVSGRAHALLQIGTGFHPDFTGRQNVYAYLAQLGITGKAADLRCDDITEFAEIEEYIDQPVKTYSTGMAMRLMFATSTAISPDLLILDEVLGVGDAYFAQKSFDRVRTLCAHDGTTLLLVSHDIYTAAKVCDRMIWLDRGRVMADMAPPDALKAYEDAIRLQEEARLRKKTLDVLSRAQTGTERGSDDTLLVEVVARKPPAEGPTHFSRIALRREGGIVIDAPLVEEGGRSSSLVTEATAWSEPTEWNGRRVRSMLHFGSPYHKIAVLFRAPRLSASAAAGMLAVEFEYGANVENALDVRAFVDGRLLAEHSLPPSASRWSTHIATLTPAVSQGLELFTGSEIGTGAVRVRAVRLLGGPDLKPVWVLQHGEPARFEIDCDVVDPSLNGRIEVGVSILRGGVETACRLFTRDLVFDAKARPYATVSLDVAENWLGTGVYTITVMFTRDGYAEQQTHRFFSTSQDVFMCVRDVLEFEVRGGNLFARGTPILARGRWGIAGRSASSDAAVADSERTSA